MASLRSIHSATLLALACCLLLLAGCGKSRKAGGGKPEEPSDGGGGFRPANFALPNDLKQLALAYNNYLDTTKKPPANAKQLAPFFDNNQKLLNKLESGEIILVYGISRTQMLREGTSKTVIAYEKDAPTRGGYVAFADISVRRVTADEFKTFKLAGQQGK